ncbi:MAG: hypothetical protein MUO31_06650 [Thermodesulfovibrionales bacterium]|nr:hypothetical protein [Thermodesulfovibrionales bacterium]
MKILVACEFSGIVRDAFAARGHDAWSCDILPTESPGQHIQGDVLEILGDGWDMMIAHPPCTYLSYAAVRSWDDKGRVFKRLEALKFFADLWEAPIEKICIENPRGCASPTVAKFSQMIQPYYFGDDAVKTTWLWLKNLPQLISYEQDCLFGKSKNRTQKPTPSYYKPDGTPRYFNEVASGKDRAKTRSVFWPSIAKAMAEQWG